MTDLIKILLIVYGSVAVAAAIAYIPKLTQFFSMFYRPEHKKATKKRRISVIIPAREESEVIGDLFSSVLKQTYDKEFFDINVVVADENDPTVELAKKIGANVFVVENQHCKGDALDGYFKAISKEKLQSYDAFVIVDADAVLTPDYIEELNNALEYDCQIFLSRKYIKNYLGGKKSRSIFCNCSVLTYPQLDDLANNARTKRGIPMNMCGQGMMIRRDVIEELDGWPYRTLTEDYELRMDCFLKGFSSMYYPYAKIYTEEVLTHSEAYKRRLRWVTGFSQCDKIYKKKIKQQAKERGTYTAGEIEFFYSLIPIITFIVITLFAMIGGLALVIIYALKKCAAWLTALLLLVIMPFGIIYTLTYLYGLLCMIAYRDVVKKVPFFEKVITLFYAPIFCWEYFPIYIQSRRCVKKNLDWSLTRHVKLSDE